MKNLLASLILLGLAAAPAAADGLGNCGKCDAGRGNAASVGVGLAVMAFVGHRIGRRRR